MGERLTPNNGSEVMFGNANWFRSESRSVAPAPTAIKGWAYYGIWLSAIFIPTGLLLLRTQIPEALIWTGIATSVLLLDLRRLRKDIRQREAIGRMHFIDDNGQPAQAETNKYVLEIRR